jgi:Mg-chelatase subunit ChlD
LGQNRNLQHSSPEPRARASSRVRRAPLSTALASLLLAALLATHAHADDLAEPPAGEGLLVILDGSGSMSEPTETGESKIVAAKRAFAEMAPELERKGIRPGLIVFSGHPSSRCEDIAMIAEPGTASASTVAGYMADVTPNGATPLAASLKLGQSYLESHHQTGKTRIMLLTDGGETCGGNPSEVAGRLRGSSLVSAVDVIGLGSLRSGEVAMLRSIAEAGSGRFGRANSTAQIAHAMESFGGYGGSYLRPGQRTPDPLGEAAYVTTRSKPAAAKPAVAPAHAVIQLVPKAPEEEEGVDVSAVPNEMHFGETERKDPPPPPTHEPPPALQFPPKEPKPAPSPPPAAASAPGGDAPAFLP